METGMRVIRYSEVDGKAWDELVQNSANGTLMHLRRFLAYHAADRFRDHSLWLADDRDRMRAVFPAAEVETADGRWLQSHPGATYGGLVLGPQVYGEAVYAALQAIVDYAKAHSFVGIRMRLPEPVFLGQHLGELDAALFEHGFQLEARELSSAVDLRGLTRENLRASLKQEIRTCVNKSLREGVTARCSEDFEAYWELLGENLATRHATKPTHSLDEILRLKELLGDRIQLVASYFENRIVAGAVLFQMSRHASHTFYLAQNYRYQQLRPLTLAIFQTIHECVARGDQFLNFGVSCVPGSRGHDMNWGLYAFKRRCGGDGVVRDTWIRRL